MDHISLLIIDPQNDFIEFPSSKESANNIPALPVPGSWENSYLTKDFIRNNIHQIKDILITLDTHSVYDIGHATFWRQPSINDKIELLSTFTYDDIEKGRILPSNPDLKYYVLEYAKHLEEKSKYPLTIWPSHCIIGSWGHSIVTPILEAVNEWEKVNLASANYIFKGYNPYTEHYSAIQAEYPIASDSGTMPNHKTLNLIRDSKVVFVAGQSLSHCVINSMIDIYSLLGEKEIAKVVILEDTTSIIPGFEQATEERLNFLKNKGMRVLKTNSEEIARILTIFA